MRRNGATQTETIDKIDRFKRPKSSSTAAYAQHQGTLRCTSCRGAVNSFLVGNYAHGVIARAEEKEQGRKHMPRRGQIALAKGQDCTGDDLVAVSALSPRK